MLEIRTKRLYIREIIIEDVDYIFSNFTEKVTKYMYPDPPKDISVTTKFVESSVRANKGKTNLQMVVFDNTTNEFLGLVALHNIDDRDPEMGIWLKEAAFGNGYGLESATALIDWAHGNLDFDYIKYPVDKNNYPSRQIPIMNNGIEVKEYVDTTPSGKKLDTVEYWINKK